MLEKLSNSFFECNFYVFANKGAIIWQNLLLISCVIQGWFFQHSLINSSGTIRDICQMISVLASSL